MTSAEVAAAFSRPVASSATVWLASARPVAANIGTLISSVFEYVSTSARRLPSRNRRAIPVWGVRPPIQLTEVPVKVIVACAPGALETAAVPPLQVLLVSPCDQPTV